MKVLDKSGKEVKNARVVYNSLGSVDVIEVDGVHYAPEAYELKEEKTVTKTKTATKKPAAKKTK